MGPAISGLGSWLPVPGPDTRRDLDPELGTWDPKRGLGRLSWPTHQSAEPQMTGAQCKWPPWSLPSHRNLEPVLRQGLAYRGQSEAVVAVLVCPAVAAVVVGAVLGCLLGHTRGEPDDACTQRLFSDDEQHHLSNSPGGNRNRQFSQGRHDHADDRGPGRNLLFRRHLLLVVHQTADDASDNTCSRPAYCLGPEDGSRVASVGPRKQVFFDIL
jgi:hypothetical protein